MPTDFVGCATPGLSDITCRARILTAVAYRGWSEVRESPACQRRLTARRLLSWLDDSGALAALEPTEEALLHAAGDDLPQQDWMSAAWRIEGAAVLAWAARAFTLPGPDQLVKLPELVEAVELLPGERTDLAPRSEEEVLALMRHCLQVLDATSGDPGERSLLARCAFERAKATRWLVGLSASYEHTWVPFSDGMRRSC